MVKNGLILAALMALVLGGIAVYIYLGYMEPTVPNIEGLSDIDARTKLKDSGFYPNFDYFFSCKAGNQMVIDGSQSPKGGTSAKRGTDVYASVSLGKIPDVVGMSEEVAAKQLTKMNFTVKTAPGRNSSYASGMVYSQDLDPCQQVGIGAAITIYINTPLAFKISSPSEEAISKNKSVVTGTASSELLETEYLWIAVNPENSPENWWPQTGGPLPVIKDGDKYRFEGIAYLGGESRDKFNIAIILVDAGLSSKIESWISYCKETGEWPPITEWGVSKREIDDAVVSKVKVILE